MNNPTRRSEEFAGQALTERAEELFTSVLDAAIEVHRHLGPGFVESLYESALAHEFQMRGIEFQRQPGIRVEYKGQAAGDARLDFLVGGCLVVELKAIDSLQPVHKAQVISYLKMTAMPLGLLLNFNVDLLKRGMAPLLHPSYLANSSLLRVQ
jgi:GxxExxY protein